MRLENAQCAMLAALDGGPDCVPDGLFAGSREAVLRGLAVHANTVSHARLVALEDTFPRTRAKMGDGVFNRLSRRFVERDEARVEPLATIGQGFSAFLDAQGETHHVPLARFEWAWLQTFHAAEGRAVSLSDMAGETEENLLGLVLARHPAARLVGPVPALEGEVPGAGGADLLLTRPEAEVRLQLATPAMVRLFAALAVPQKVCNLLAQADEPEGVDASTALIALIEAGALAREGCLPC